MLTAILVLLVIDVLLRMGQTGGNATVLQVLRNIETNTRTAGVNNVANINRK